MTKQPLRDIACQLIHAVMVDPGVERFESDRRIARTGQADWRVSLPLGHPRQYPSLLLTWRGESLMLGVFLHRWSRWPWRLIRPRDGFRPLIELEYLPPLDLVHSWRLNRWSDGTFGFGDFGCPASPLPVAEDGTAQVKSAAGEIAVVIIGAILRCLDLPHDEAAVQRWRTGQILP